MIETIPKFPKIEIAYYSSESIVNNARSQTCGTVNLLFARRGVLIPLVA